MKLTYRGVDYDYNPAVLDVTESEAVGQYRGQATKFSYVRHVPIPQPTELLKVSRRRVSNHSPRPNSPAFRSDIRSDIWS